MLRATIGSVAHSILVVERTRVIVAEVVLDYELEGASLARHSMGGGHPPAPAVPQVTY